MDRGRYGEKDTVHLSLLRGSLQTGQCPRCPLSLTTVNRWFSSCDDLKQFHSLEHRPVRVPCRASPCCRQ